MNLNILMIPLQIQEENQINHLEVQVNQLEVIDDGLVFTDI